MKPIEMSWKMTKLSKILLWVLLAIVIVGAGVWGYFYKFKISDKISPIGTEKSYQLAIYTLVQNEKARVIAYDPKTKEHKELMAIDYKDKYASFSADYSSSLNKIVYSDDNGISVYDLKDKTTSNLLANVKPKNPNEPDGTARNYSAPRWSKDYKKIVYQGFAWESMNWSVMDSDGKNPIQLESEGFSFAWSPDGKKYAIGSQSGMGTGPGLNVSLADPITKTKQVLSVKDMRQVDSLAWKDKIYFSGAISDDPNTNKFEIDSINADGTDIKVLDKDEYNNQGLIADEDGTLYYSKNIFQTTGNSSKSAGIYSIKTDGTDKALFYQDGDKNLLVQSLNSDYVAIQSTVNSQSSDALRSLLLVNKTDKQATLVGEAVRINFVGWIKSNKLPDGLTKLKTPEPTEAEKTIYSDSQKTHGYLYATYYDYCWDYNCGSATYPYPKLAASATPEIITLSNKPNQLTGDVTVPVVFAYDSIAYTDEQLAVLKNNDLVVSYGYFEKWLNAEAKRNGASLNFKLDYKTSQFKIDQSCVSIQGTNRAMDMTCLKEKIGSAYPELKDTKNVFVSIAKDDSMNYSYNNNGLSYSSEGSLIISTVSGYWLKKTIKEFTDILISGGYNFDYYNAKQFLSQYGAKDLVASYKAPIENAQSACYVDVRADVMCRSWMADPLKGYSEHIKLDAAEISTATAKALGWYDADGDGVVEVKDKCPFDRKNAC